MEREALIQKLERPLVLHNSGIRNERRGGRGASLWNEHSARTGSARLLLCRFVFPLAARLRSINVEFMI